MGTPLVVNNLRAERLAAGIQTVEELAARAGIDPTWCSYIEDGRVLATRDEHERLRAALGDLPANRIYDRSWRMLVETRPGDSDGMAGQAHMWQLWRAESRLLMHRSELTYFDHDPGPDHDAEVYVNLSCGTQRSPHLLLDTVSVLQTLGVKFVAAAGPTAGCCGKPQLMYREGDVYDRFRASRLARSRAWGVTTHVNWCGACQQTSGAVAAKHQLAEGIEHPVRELQLIPFLEERVRELGDQVPWQHEVPRRVMAEGHPGMGNVHFGSQQSILRLMSMIPGVEPVGLYDGWAELSPCAAFGLEGAPPPEWTRRPETSAEREEHRRRLAAELDELGADTVSCMHQACHQMWSCYASNDLAVLHPVSVLAEALGCAHPDRFQQAARAGEPRALVEESRPRWESWGMTEEKAAEVAESICNVATVAGYANNDFRGHTDPQAFANALRHDAGFSCGGGCGGCCGTA